VDPFESYVRGGLELAGETLDDVELHVMRAADAVYGPQLTALAEADLAGVWQEPAIDPARAPAPDPRSER